jgi:ADP-heptose:LPS heptosyltransferase/glycosyltransferase involved in cell wall biosynthesis
LTAKAPLPPVRRRATKVSAMLSVLLLTRDRKTLLRECLDSLERQRGVSEPWEILVVDTGSSDGARKYLGRWATLAEPGGPEHRWKPFGRPPGFGEERAAGFGATLGGRGALPSANGAMETGAFARARNFALAEARGEKLLFTDDDCVLPPDWVARASRALDSWDAVGGLVLAANQLPFRRWWSADLAWLPGLSAPGMLNPDWAGSIFYPQTANLALRRSALPPEPFPSFLGDFGAGGGIYANEREDSALWRRLRRLGRKVAIDPGLIVFHHTPPERAQLRTLLRRAWRDGRAEAFQRFNREAAAMAAEAIGENLIGALTSAFTPARKSTPPFVWALRETAHAWTYAKLAPPKFRRPLAGPFFRGFAAAPVQQARRIAGDIARAQAARSAEPPPPPDSPRTIALIADGFLGDMVLLEPPLRALKSQPDAPRVVLATSKRYGGALHGLSPHVDATIFVDEKASPKTALREALEAESPALALVAYWHHRPGGELARALENIPSVGFDKDAGLERRRHVAALTHRLEKDWRLHEIDNLARLLQWGGLKTPPGEFDYSYLPEGADSEKVPVGSIFLHWGSAEEAKRWSEERWAELMLALTRETGAPLVIAGAPDEADAIDEQLRFFGVRALNGARWDCLKARHAIPTLRRGRLMVCCCSGPKHLAIAAGLPTVTLYGPSSPERWGDYFHPERHCALRKMPAPLTPSEAAGLPPHHALLEISVAEVLQAALEALQPPPSKELPSLDTSSDRVRALPAPPEKTKAKPKTRAPKKAAN